MSNNCPDNSEDVDAYRFEEKMMDGCVAFKGPLYVNGLKSRSWKTLYNPVNLEKLMKCKDTCVAEKTQWNDDMNNLPPEVMNIIDEITDNQDCQESALQQESDEINNSPDQIESECRSTPDGFDECITSEPMHVEEQSEQAEQCIAYDVMVERIKEQDKDRKKPKWMNLNAQEIKRLLSSTPDILLKQLTKQELRICADVIKESTADTLVR